jgi:integrase
MPALPPSQTRAYTVEELRRLHAAAVKLDAEFGRLVLWLTLTGLRRGEAIAARWDWVDGYHLRIPDPDPVTGWRPKRGPRSVPMSDETMSLLVRGEHASLWRWSSWPQHLAERTWSGAKLDGSAHRLRHTFASLFLANVPNLWLLGQVMGHTSSHTTEQYLHFVPGHDEQARGAVKLGTMGTGHGSPRLPAAKRRKT